METETEKLKRELKACEKARAKIERELAHLKRSLGPPAEEPPKDSSKLPVTIATDEGDTGSGLLGIVAKDADDIDVVLDTTKDEEGDG